MRLEGTPPSISACLMEQFSIVTDTPRNHREPFHVSRASGALNSRNAPQLENLIHFCRRVLSEVGVRGWETSLDCEMYDLIMVFLTMW